MSNKKDKLKLCVKKLSTKDVDEYNALLRYSFQVTEDELNRTGWREKNARRIYAPRRTR